MDSIEWLNGVVLYARSAITPGVVVLATSAVVGAVSAVVAVLLARDVSRALNEPR